MNIQRFTFFLTDNLLLLYCSVTWSLLTQTDTDWTCWLKADALVWKPNSNLKLTQTSCHAIYVVHCLQTAQCWLLLMRQRWQNRSILSCHLMTTPCKKCYLLDFKKLPNQDSIDILMQPSKALFVANSKLSTNAYLVQLCAEDGRRRLPEAMFCASWLPQRKPEVF